MVTKKVCCQVAIASQLISHNIFLRRPVPAFAFLILFVASHQYSVRPLRPSLVPLHFHMAASYQVPI